MARYVLLKFDDNDDASEALVTIQRNGHIRGELSNLQCVVRGVWACPTKYCECGTAKPGYTRGRKYGWWVHAACGKPTKGWANGEIWYTALGTNLLPICDDAPENRGPGHKQHPGYNRW
jgi:hypothetical protein